MTVKDGLSQSNAVAIAQDSAGYLWIGTLDGLNRYDGNEFRIYKKYFYDQHSDKGYSHTGKVYADREGHLWIIPIEKIPEKYDRENDRFVPIDSLREVSCMYQDKHLNLWFGSYGRGLYCLERKTGLLKQVLSPDHLSVHIHHITEDRSGSIIASGLGAVFLIDQYSFRTRKIQIVQGDLNQQVYYSVSAIDNSNNTWVGTYEHGLYFKSSNATAYQNVAALNLSGDPIPEKFAVMDLKMDRKNRLWIASYGKGLFMIDLNKKTSYNFTAEKHNPTSIPYNDIDCIYEDHAGVLWFGTDGAGLSYYDEYLEKFHSVTNNQLPADIHIDVVRAITKDNQGIIWIGTYGNGLTRYDPLKNSWQNYLPNSADKNSIASNRVISLMADKENELWVGTQYPGGLSMLERDGRFRQINSQTIPSLNTEAVWCIYQDQHNNHWLGTMDNGLILFDKKRGALKTYTTTNSDVPSNNIRTIAEGNNGLLWLGTESEGICAFDPVSEQFKVYTFNPKNQNSLSGNSIKSLHFDRERDVLWIGTYGEGLCALEVETEKFYRFDTKSGLANDVIYGILADENGNLWLSSNKGITRFTPPKQLHKKAEIVNYSDYDLVATEFNTGAYLKDQNGQLYFGGMEGIYWIDPSHFSQNKTIPKTAITRFEVFGNAFNMTEKATLKHNQNTVSFSFTGFQFSMPAKTAYQYKLEDHDEKWAFLRNQNYVRYTNLKPGDYRFLVKAANYDGIWSTTPATFSFTIKHPWYKSTTAWITYFVLLTIGLYLAYRYLKWHLSVQYQLTYNKKESERLKQIHDFKSQLFTDISHEIRTPLTLITGPVQKQLDRDHLSDDDRRDMVLIQRNAERMLQLVDQLLELSKLEAGIVKLNVREGNISNHIKSVVATFEHETFQKDISFHSYIPENIQGWYDSDILDKVLNNLLSNAIKYSAKNGAIHFEARKEGPYLLLLFSNTTETHYTSEDIENIFGRFHRQHNNVDGSGVGLSIVKELVTLSHGHVEAGMKGLKEIEFVVTLPIHPNYYIDKKTGIEESEEEKPKKHPAESRTVDEPTVEKPVLLVIDDNADIRQFVASIAADEFVITEAKDGEEGVRLALEGIPDLIVSDVMMPVQTGIEVCRVLKNDERTSHIPIILLTAKAGEENELEGLSTGADDYVIKPFSAKKLLLKMRNLVNSRKKLRQKYNTELVLKPKDLAITSADEKFFLRLQDALENNITDPQLNADTLSKLVGLSRMQLHRKLMAFTGLSTTAFIKSERCKLALAIIRDTNTTVSEAAYATGFSSPSYFIKSFKDIYKFTPLEYLKKN